MRAVADISRDVTKSVGHSVSLPLAKLCLLLSTDFLFTQTFVNVLNVMSWRGVWGLHTMWMGIVFKDSSNFVACLATCGFAFLCNLGICLISPHVDSFLHVLSPFPRILVSRTFTIVNFTNSMLLWRSFWGFFDMVFISDFYLILSFTLTTLVFVGFACFNTLNGVPASVELDWMGQKEYCTVSTLMQDRDFSDMSRCEMAFWRLVDALCTGVLEVVAILSWYGVYQLVVENLPTAPEVNLLTENLVPTLLGFVTGLLALMLQVVLLILVEREREDGKRLKRRRVAHFFISCFGLLSSILYWSGGWGLLDTYFLPSQPLASLVISAVVGIVGMMVTGTSRSLHGGLSRDGREEEAYPLQPYYFLALIPWQYEHLDEEYA